MHVIGIVGGVASGKSLVADELRALGAVVLDADCVGHEVLCEPEVEAALRARWGDKVFGPHGHIDRRAVAKIVFAPPPASNEVGPACRAGPSATEPLGPATESTPARQARATVRQAGATEELAFLESVSHPRISARLTQELAELRQRGDVPAVVLDAALLFRGGWDKLCDQILFIDAPREMRLARAQARGWTAEHFAAREAAQEPLDEKRRSSHVVIDNSDTPKQTQEQVRRYWMTLII